MRNELLTTLAITLIAFTLGCGSTSPVTPDTPENASDKLPSWTIEVEGQTLTLGLADLLSERSASDIVVPGTDMDAAELRIYFTVNIVEANVPFFFYCACWDIMYPVFLSIDDTTVESYVVMMENAGFDVPQGPAPDPIC